MRPTDPAIIEDRKARARRWFEALRNDICAAFERLEDDAPRRSIPAARAGSCARPGTAPITPASPAAAA